MPLSNSISDSNKTFDGDDTTWAVAATERVNHRWVGTTEGSEDSSEKGFLPLVPASFREAGLRESQVEALILKFLLNVGGATGREVANQIALPFGILEPLLHSLKAEQLVVFTSGTPLGDYTYRLTELGAERARRYAQQSSYFGAAPVTLSQYEKSVVLQSISRQRPTLDAVRTAFNDLVLSDSTLQLIGEAIFMGLGAFLHGAPGNGKSSIAERITESFGDGIWIPRSIGIGGEIIRVFDPNHHEPISLDEQAEVPFESPYDRRWVFVKRPTLIVGGELELAQLDIKTNPSTNISEAPIQLKANGGTLVFDDFGRNRFSPDELLNRLIVPLEKRIDHLHTAGGRTFQVPFDPMVVFSTNLPPHDLVDEAFLRRIPFTVNVTDPTIDEFRNVFNRVASQHGLNCDERSLDYLIEKHYEKAGRPMRFCHARDLIRQISNAVQFNGVEPAITEPFIDRAVANCLDLRSEVI